MEYRQFKVVIRDSEGNKHKFTYRAVDENEVVEKVKKIIPGCVIKSVDPVK